MKIPELDFLTLAKLTHQRLATKSDDDIAIGSEVGGVIVRDRKK